MNTIDWIVVQIAVLVVWIALLVYFRRSPKVKKQPSAAPKPPANKDDTADLYAALDKVEPRLHQSAHPENLLDAPEFQAVVEMLCRPDTKTVQLLRYLGGDNVSLACAAGEALRRRENDPNVTYAILAEEAGLHVWEIPSTGRDFTRYQVRVRVAPQLDEPLYSNLSQLDQAERIFADMEEGKLQITRRYREEPSPLVRDSSRGWRSGRLDRVLDGDFDLIT